MAVKKEGLKKAINAVESSPERVYRTLVGGTYGFLDIIKRILRWFFTWGLVILFILLIVIVLRCWYTGTCTTILGRLGFAIGETPAAAVAEKGVLSVWQVLWDPASAIKPGGAFSFDDKQQQVEEFGLQIEKFRVDPGAYEAGEPISATATMKAKAPKDEDLVIDFSDACSMQDYTGEVDVSGPFTDGKKIIVIAGSSDSFQVGCEFPDGIKTVTNDVEDKTITFRPRYEMTQEVTWRVYSKNTRQRNDQNLGVTKSLVEGPMIFSLYSLDSQPFYVGTVYRIYVGLDNNKIVWRGTLDKIKSIDLSLPDNVKLDLEDRFCRFKQAGSEQGFNLYDVKDEYIADANLDCWSKEFLVKKGISLDDCIKAYKDSVQFSCKFTYNNAEDVAAQQEFKATTVYSYIAEEKTFVTLTKQV